MKIKNKERNWMLLLNGSLLVCPVFPLALSLASYLFAFLSLAIGLIFLFFADYKILFSVKSRKENK